MSYVGTEDPMRNMPYYEDWNRSGRGEDYTSWLAKREREIQSGAAAPVGAGPQLASMYAAGQAQNPQNAMDASARARELEMARGQGRWLTATRDPRYQDVMRRYADMSRGLNAQEMQAAREQMQMGQQSQRQQALRSLYSQQAKSGVRGGMAGAQNARLQQKLAQDRNAAEQALLLQNYALKRQGLQDYGGQVNRDIFGQLGTGLAEAQLGVADRTGAQQMAMANQQYQNARRRGFFGDVLELIGF